MTSRIASVLLLSVLALAGCTAPDDDGGEASANAAVSGNPVYDAVVRDGTKVETDATRSAEQSAKTHLVGFVPGASTERVLGRLLTVERWTEIQDAEGERPFTDAVKLSDTSENGVRTIVSSLTLDGGVKLEVRGTARDGASGLEVRMTNSTAYKHWLIGTVLEPNKLQIAFDLVPYQGGVIVDATIRAKLKKKEDRAPELTRSLQPIFAWLEAGSR